MTVTAANAARIARVSLATIRTWCRKGLLVAVKVNGRWYVNLRSLATYAPLRMPTDRPRAGEHRTAKTGRAARRLAAAIKARAFARKHGMPVITHVHRARVAAHNGGLLLAGQYLADLAGAEFAAKYGSAFGKACKAAYRRSHNGADPAQDGWWIAGGRIRPAYSYSSEQDLVDGANAYPNTAALLAA